VIPGVTPTNDVVCRGMNILIENAETQEFLASDGRWTKESSQGASFATTRAALTAAKSEPIGKFNIVGQFGGSEQFINLDCGRGKGASSRPPAQKSFQSRQATWPSTSRFCPSISGRPALGTNQKAKRRSRQSPAQTGKARA